MSAPYGGNNSYNGYAADPINRAPSPYDPPNRVPSPYHQQDPSQYQQMQASNPHNNGYNGYTADPVNRAPSPYHQQAPSAYQQTPAPNSYYGSHPQQYDSAVPIE